MLNDPGHDGKLSTAEVDTLEAVDVAGARSLLDFKLVGVNHHSKGIFDVEVGVVLLRGELGQSCTSLVKLAVADEPPRRFRSEESDQGDGDGPDPLNSVGNAIRPLAVAGNETLEDARGKKLTHNPAKVDIGGQVWAKRHRAHLGGVGGGQSLEDTPWKAG